MLTDAFLGTGWSFPPTFFAGGAEVVMTSGLLDIHQSLEILLRTRPGERLMQETFGCDLDAMMFAEVNATLIGRVEAVIADAILLHEPRVQLIEVDVDPTREAGVLEIHVKYAVPATNSRHNMVFPFYLHEASEPAV